MKNLKAISILKYVITSVFITLLLSGTIIKPLFEISTSIDDTLIITATNEKNNLSWGNEIRISKIVINGQQLSLDKITLSDNWRLYEDGLLGSYNNQAPSVIKIPIKELKVLEIEFIKQCGSGFVNVQIGKVNQKYDLYSSNENWEKYTWNYETEKIFNPFSNITALIGCYILVYLSLVFITKNIYKFESNKLKKRLAISSIIACVQWIISFYTDRFAFKYYNNQFNFYQNLMKNHKMLSYKIIYMILLLAIWYCIAKLYDNIKNNDIKTKVFIRYFVPYWAVMVAFLSLTWPGVWRWDEFEILKNMMNLDLTVWQHYITSIFYIFGFMIFPFPGGLVFLQITIISIIVGYIISKFAMMFDNNRWVNILYIPFLLLPVIDQNLYPLRLSLYSYIELLFFCKLIFLYKDNKGIGIQNILFLSILSGLLATWRSEGIFFIVCSPIIFCILFLKETDMRTKVYYTLLVVVFTVGFMSPQQYLIKDQGGKNYSITAFIEPLDDLVKLEYSKEPNSNLLKSVDKVLFVNKLIEAESGEIAFWNGAVKEDFTESDLTYLKQAFIRLIIKYPKEFVIERTKTFLMTSGCVFGRSNQIYDTVNLFDNTTHSKYIEFRDNFIFNDSINRTLRKDVISLMEGRNFKTYSKTTILYPIMYNLFLPVSGLLLIFIAGLFKKKILNICITIPLLLQFALVYLAAPGIYFMYYFPHYLIGYFLIFLYIFIRIYNKKTKSNFNFF